MKVVIIILLSLLMAACATKQPKTLGIPLTQWTKLSKAQQETVIKNYNLPSGKLYANQPIITNENIPSLSNALPNKKTIGETSQTNTAQQNKRPTSWLQLNGS